MSICHKNHEMPLCLNCPKFGQLIIRKIIRIVATVKFLGVKMHKIGLRLGLRPRRHLRSLRRSSGPWLHLRGPISKGRGGEGGKRRRKGESKKSLGPQSSPQIDATGHSPRMWRTDGRTKLPLHALRFALWRHAKNIDFNSPRKIVTKV